MAERQTAQNADKLEDQLRNMILSNVTISNGQANQGPPSTSAPPPQSPRSHGRGRGRGGFFRGRSGDHFNQSGRGQNANAPTQQSSAPRGGRKDASRPRNHCNSRVDAQANPPSPTVDGSHAQPMPPTGYRPPKVARQPKSPGETPQAGPGGPGGPRRILQRPPNLAATHQSSGPPSAPMLQRHHVHPQYMPQPPRENPFAQVDFLDRLAAQEVPKVEITLVELEEKENFRTRLEKICQKAFNDNYVGDIATISLAGFGSLASGYATPGSDMDLAIIPGWKDPSKAEDIGIGRDIPRLLERAVLDAGLGARLLTRTRVPILKVCQSPTEELYKALLEEREKWDELPEEEKYPPTLPLQTPTEPSLPKPLVDIDGQKPPELMYHPKTSGFGTEEPPIQTKSGSSEPGSSKGDPPSTPTKKDQGKGAEQNNGSVKDHNSHLGRPWLREKKLGPLDFPKTGVGIQCDVNFENPLGIHNTQLLRCYSLCDPRVRPMVLFVKAWAKRRKINSSYSGTLSSYGWVLMVLHYLVNVAQPPVCPNLQISWGPPFEPTTVKGLEQMHQYCTINGYEVRFWRNEEEIMHYASQGRLTRNQESVGSLLRGFFVYYASAYPGYMYGPKPASFYWTTEVLSLRTPGGIRLKSEKGWTGAKTTVSAGKEVRHRYLFAIEDPFELDHNVARTVTHNGIVAIRDEFRRVWRIIGAVGRGAQPEGGIFDEVIEPVAPPTPKTPREGELPKQMGMEDVVVDGEEGAVGK